MSAVPQGLCIESAADFDAIEVVDGRRKISERTFTPVEAIGEAGL